MRTSCRSSHDSCISRLKALATLIHWHSSHKGCNLCCHDTCGWLPQHKRSRPCASVSAHTLLAMVLSAKITKADKGFHTSASPPASLLHWRQHAWIFARGFVWFLFFKFFFRCCSCSSSFCILFHVLQALSGSICRVSTLSRRSGPGSTPCRKSRGLYGCVSNKFSHCLTRLLMMYAFSASSFVGVCHQGRRSPIFGIERSAAIKMRRASEVGHHWEAISSDRHVAMAVQAPFLRNGTEGVDTFAVHHWQLFPTTQNFDK